MNNPEPLSPELAQQLAQLALDGIEREYPHKPGGVLAGDSDLRPPREVHPVFFGCFDWHSAVHSHWLLVRLLRVADLGPLAREARALLARQLTAPKLAAEAEYFTSPSNQSFERMYGWAWALRLAAELAAWPDPDAAAWAANLTPLERLVQLTHNYLPRLRYPVRSGVHSDTAFALGQVLDYAWIAGDRRLATLVSRYASDCYREDRFYPAGFEPSGEDFFSPAWNEADLMRRVLRPSDFSEWLLQFLPELESGKVPGLEPAEVTDLADGRIVHLVGLNLSRAWTQQGVLEALPPGDARRPVLEASAARHAEAGLAQLFSGHYEGEHWLGTFAVYLLTGAGARDSRQRD